MTTDSRPHATAVVLAEVLAAGRVTRAALVGTTGLAGASVSRAVDALLAQGLVRETATEHGRGRGRPGTLIEPVAERQAALGIDLGASNTRMVLCDLLGRRLASRREATPTGLDGAGLAAWLGHRARDLIDSCPGGQAGVGAQADAGAQAGPGVPPVDAVGLGLPGAVRPDTGEVFDAPNLPAVEDPAFRRALPGALGLPPVLDNDANYAVLAEQRLGAARGVDTAVLFTIGAGLGAGVYLGSDILRGRTGLVGEFGHLPVGPLGGPLEHMVTGPGILARARELGIDLGSPSELFTAEASGARAELGRRVLEALGIMLTAATVSYEPDVILLAGGIGESLAGSLDALGEALEVILRRRPPTLGIAGLGDMSGALGAAVAALHTIYRDLGVGAQDLARLPAPPGGSARDPGQGQGPTRAPHPASTWM